MSNNRIDRHSIAGVDRDHISRPVQCERVGCLVEDQRSRPSKGVGVVELQLGV